MKRIQLLSAGLIAGALSMASAHATIVNGIISCANGTPFANVTVSLTGTNCDGDVNASTQTDENGYYQFEFPLCAGTYTETVDPSTLPADAVLTTASQTTFSVTVEAPDYSIFWTVDSSECSPPPVGDCKLVGAGAAEVRYNRFCTSIVLFGGVVNPDCSLPGEGGCWEHIDYGKCLKFKSTEISVVDCGIVPIPANECQTPRANNAPYNYIEFTGTGKVTGLRWGCPSYSKVYFVARAEDRQGAGKWCWRWRGFGDRYSIRVFTDLNDPVGSTVMYYGGNDPDPVLDTHRINIGNLEIRHCN